jgi:hypothetical protein
MIIDIIIKKTFYSKELCENKSKKIYLIKQAKAIKFKKKF